MNPEAAALLEQLRDIHAAGSPSWWPPAPGWWVLALLLALAGAYLGRWLWRRLVSARRRRAWLRAVDELQARHDPQLDPHGFLAGLNRVFRAVALRAFPAEPCARLEGEQWVAFIRERLGAGATPALGALGRGPYQPQPEFDADTLVRQAQQWVRRYG